VDLQEGNIARAYTLTQESLDLFKEVGDQQGVAQALSGLGTVAFLQGDYAQAHTLLLQSLEIARRVDNKWFRHMLSRQFFDNSASYQVYSQRNRHLCFHHEEGGSLLWLKLHYH
jgi:ATP/maltotriose-dependent transcriptional regulator MalT